MGIFRSIGRGILKVGSHMFNVRVDRWASYQYLKGTFQQTSAIVQDTFTPPVAPKTKERFEDVVQRLGLSEQDIHERYRAYIRLFLIYGGLFLAILSYTVYMAFTGHFVSTLMALCLSAWMASFCFRYHYWSFQIKHRKLGCTLKEWFESRIIQEE